MLVILDAKRGDIGPTAEGYAEGYLGADSSCPCDAITVNPYMGVDTLEPFVAVAEREGKGVVVLARTSNPGSKDFQQPTDRRPRGRAAVSSMSRSALAADDRKRLRGPDSGLVGPDAGRRGHGAGRSGRGCALRCGRRALPRAGLWRAGRRALVDSVAGFVKRGRHGLEGGVVNASRSVAIARQGALEASAAVKDVGALHRPRRSLAAQAELVEAATKS
jgi:orotidine-5'-phosphate decarboxylase